MSSFHYRLYCLVISAILPFLCSSQSTICVWDSVDTRDHLNGEYVLGGSQLNQPYWQKVSATCASTTHYIFYAEDKYGFWWFIDDELKSKYIKTTEQPYCESTPPDPTQCTGWYWWSNQGHNGAVPLTVNNGPCPSLQCNKIELTNTGYSQCNKIFTKQDNMDNVFVNGATFLYFNKQTFKWYCSNTLGSDECDDDDNINHFYVSSQDDEWNDVAIDSSFQLRLSNGYSATFKCMGPTSAPTSDPTTPSPVDSTNTATIGPTNDTTKTPTIHPTNGPTKGPTKYPTSVPTYAPTKATTEAPTTSTAAATSTTITTSTAATTSTMVITSTSGTVSTAASTSTAATASTTTTGTKTGEIVVVRDKTTAYPQKEDVVHDITTATPMDGVSDKKGDSNTGNGILDDMLMVYIIAGSLLFVVILTICIVFIYLRKNRSNEGKNAENKTNVNKAMQLRVASTEMSSVNLSELCMETTPNLTAFNRTVSGSNMTPITPMGDENQLVLSPINRNIITATPGSPFSADSVVSVGSNIIDDEQRNTEEGIDGDDDDELYTAVPRQITIGGPSGIDEPEAVTNGGDDDNNDDEDNSGDDNHDEMYTKPDKSDIATAGNDDDDDDDQDVLDELYIKSDEFNDFDQETAGNDDVYKD